MNPRISDEEIEEIVKAIVRFHNGVPDDMSYQAQRASEWAQKVRTQAVVLEWIIKGDISIGAQKGRDIQFKSHSKEANKFFGLPDIDKDWWED